MKHNLFNSEKEYLKWVRKVKIGSDGLAKIPDPHELALELRADMPVKYPVITVSYFESSFDRFGDSTVLLWEHVYLAEFTEKFNPYRKEDEIEAEEELLRPYFAVGSELVKLMDYWNPKNYGPMTKEKSAKVAELSEKHDKLNKKYGAKIDAYFERRGMKV